MWLYSIFLFLLAFGFFVSPFVWINSEFSQNYWGGCTFYILAIFFIPGFGRIFNGQDIEEDFFRLLGEGIFLSGVILIASPIAWFVFAKDQLFVIAALSGILSALFMFIYHDKYKKKYDYV